jgi:hypothetical protein|tara:strand:+ start:290 stop:442 length:153 start_codon:yes stop_codon:yes gene_type:complete
MPEPPLQEVIDYVSQMTIADLLKLLTAIRIQLISRGVRDDAILDTGWTKP